MFFSVNKLNCLGILVAILATQVYTIHSLDPKLQQCRTKLIEQLKKVDVSKPPSCLNLTKINEAKKHTDVLTKVFTTIPPECKNGQNIRTCFKNLIEHYKNHTEELQSSMVGAIDAVTQGSEGCVGEIVQQFNTMDDYIQNGCP